ncbi:hypothetical protein PMS51_08080, partial [Bifidobacterium longum]|nr:hypothetical protein [Bifidobacterium longum]MDB6819608.1 hypothetical protein [Bifidobacterium longum]
MNIFPSALKHGIEPDDAMYVVEHPLRDLVLREDPPKVLYLGRRVLVIVATPDLPQGGSGDQKPPKR